MIFNFLSTNNNSRVFLILPVSMCVSLRLLTLKASSALISSNAKEQMNHGVLKTFLSPAKFLHWYFEMQHQFSLTSYFILFTH